MDFLYTIYLIYKNLKYELPFALYIIGGVLIYLAFYFWPSAEAISGAGIVDTITKWICGGFAVLGILIIFDTWRTKR